jgi:hypothetical protein
VSQFFHRSSNTIARLSLIGIILLVSGVATALALLYRSPFMTNQNVPNEQPIQFSHEHHVAGLGLDCRYCHINVENSSFAGIPPSKTCMNCHSQMYVDSPYLEPVRESWRTDQSIPWTRVHNLPDHVYFNHSIHIAKGVGCATCHGRVDEMPLLEQANTLQMKWCLQCHRNPEKYVRPKDQVFSMSYVAPKDQVTLGKKLVKEYHIEKKDTCSTCHR